MKYAHSVALFFGLCAGSLMMATQVTVYNELPAGYKIKWTVQTGPFDESLDDMWVESKAVGKYELGSDKTWFKRINLYWLAADGTVYATCEYSRSKDEQADWIFICEEDGIRAWYSSYRNAIHVNEHCWDECADSKCKDFWGEKCVVK